MKQHAKKLEVRWLNNRKHKRAIAAYKAGRLALATPASFPDSGLYYGKLRRDVERLRETVISKLPLRKRILIEYHLQKLEDEMIALYYYTAVHVDEDGREWTASDLDNQFTRG